jgi:hypothetical protein
MILMGCFYWIGTFTDKRSTDFFVPICRFWVKIWHDVAFLSRKIPVIARKSVGRRTQWHQCSKRSMAALGASQATRPPTLVRSLHPHRRKMRARSSRQWAATPLPVRLPHPAGLLPLHMPSPMRAAKSPSSARPGTVRALALMTQNGHAYLRRNCRSSAHSCFADASCYCLVAGVSDPVLLPFPSM